MKGNKRSKITLVILVLILLISVGYAALTTVLKINSDIRLSKVTFGIHFDNVQPAQHKAIVDTEAYILDPDTKKEISFAVAITQLEDYYRFTTDIVNEGSIPGVIKSIELQGLTESQKKLINYKLTYTASGKKLAVGDYFGPHSTKNVTVDVIYELDEDIDDADLPEDDVQLECVLVINFTNGSIGEYRARAASSKLMQDVNFMSSSAVNFGTAVSSSSYEGAYILAGTENDDFPIYFYRGGHTKTKNNVIFGGYCWRIIRTTDTGGIKIIYNGTPTEDNQCTNTTNANTQIAVGAFGSNNTYANSSGAQRLYSWYFENLINNQAYLEDTVFCNNDTYANGSVSLECDENSQVSVSNQKNIYPVGLLTAQEATLAGLTTSSGSYSYLYTGQNYWTMSKEIDVRGTDQNVWSVIDGRLQSSYYIYYAYGYGYNGWTGKDGAFRPVVSLNCDTQLVDGDGSMGNPYKVTLN